MKKFAIAAVLLVFGCSLLFATDTLYKSLIGKEDINWGTGTFDRKTSTGSNISVTKVSDSSIPISNQSGGYLDHLFHSGHSLSIYPGNVTGSVYGRISGFDFGASGYTDNAYFQYVTGDNTGRISGFTIGASGNTDNATIGTANITTAIITTDNITTANITTANLTTLNVTGTPTFTDNTINGADITDNTITPAKIRWRGAVVYKTTTTDDDICGNGSNCRFSWTSEYSDTDSIHGNADNAYLVVPSGVSLVRLRCQIGWPDNATGYRTIQIQKSPSTYVCYHSHGAQGTGFSYAFVTCTSPVVSVTAGDKFSCLGTQTSGGNLTVAGDGTLIHSFEMEIVQ